MPDSFLIILIPIIALVISFISTKGTLTDLKYKKRWWKIVTKRGWLVILLTFVIAGLLWWQNFLNNQKEKTKDELLKKEKATSDSTISSRVDSNRKVLFNDLSVALAKQNLQFDSAQRKIENLVRDSTNQKITIINSEDPNFDICDIKPILKTDDSLILKYFFCSENATSYDINVTIDIISKTTSNNQYFPLYNNLNFLPPNSVINKGKNLSINQYWGKWPKADIYFFRIKGTYKKFDGKILTIDRILSYDFSDPHFGPPNALVYSELQKMIKEIKW